MGLTGVQLMAFPNGGGKPLPEDDRFWATSIDLRMPVSIHVELDRSGKRGGKMLDYPSQDDRVTTELAFQVQRFATRGGGTNAVQLLLSGLFDRFPDLRVCLAETSIGWVPFFLEIADVRYNRHIHWAQTMHGFTPLKAMPSELHQRVLLLGLPAGPLRRRPAASHERQSPHLGGRLPAPGVGLAELGHGDGAQLHGRS